MNQPVMIPRYYQDNAVNSLFDYFIVKDGNPIVAMPTGTGKSLVISEFLKRVFHYPGQRVMMLTHVKELIVQNMLNLVTVWPSAPAGIYSAGLKQKNVGFPITYAGIGSVYRKPELFGHIDLIIIDECHLVSPKNETMYQKFISELKKVNPYLKVIGLTATTFRLGQGGLTEGGLFTDICFDITGIDEFNKLVHEGFLAPLIAKATTEKLKTDHVRILAGEFIQSELQQAVDVDEVTRRALKEVVNTCPDRKHWLIFCTGIDHTAHVADMLNDEFGISCGCVHSKMKDTRRDEIIQEFKDGKTRAIANNNILTTGFDYKQIDLIVMLRPTSSPGLWVQMLGRGTRPYEDEEYKKENCLVLDFAGNTRRLGPINDPVLPKRKGKGGGGEAPVKECDSCHMYCHASVRFCDHCGYEFPKNVKIREFSYSDEVMADGAPKVEIFDVDQVVYNIHEKQDRPDSIAVTYHCGMRRFREWVCIEHGGFAAKKARNWWRERDISEEVVLPETTPDALNMMGRIMTPTHIRVWINKKHPEIMAFDFHGTRFGELSNLKTSDEDIPF